MAKESATFSSAYFVNSQTGDVDEERCGEFKQRTKAFEEKFGKSLTYNLKDGYPSANKLNEYMKALNQFNTVFTESLAKDTPAECKDIIRNSEGISELTNIFEKINNKANDEDKIVNDTKARECVDKYKLDTKFSEYEGQHHKALEKIYTGTAGPSGEFPFIDFYNTVKNANFDKFDESSITNGTEKDYHKLKGQWTTDIVNCLLRLGKMTDALEEHRSALTKVKDVYDNAANKAKGFKINVKKALNEHVVHSKPFYEVLKVCDTVVGKQFIFLDKFVNAYHAQIKAQAVASQTSNDENKSNESLSLLTERYSLYDEFEARVKRAESVSHIYDNLATLSAVSSKYGYTKSMEALVGSEIDKFLTSAPSNEALSTLMLVVIAVLVAAILAVVVFVVYKLFKKGGAGSEACKKLVEMVKEMTGWINK